jgi:hypothetical protein
MIKFRLSELDGQVHGYRAFQVFAPFPFALCGHRVPAALLPDHIDGPRCDVCGRVVAGLHAVAIERAA